MCIYRCAYNITRCAYKHHQPEDNHRDLITWAGLNWLVYYLDASSTITFDELF